VTHADVKAHRDRVQAKYEKVQGLSALLDTCLLQPNPDEAYIRELKVKLRTAKCNLATMTTDLELIDNVR
jgi:hypothetical protein